MKIAIIVQARIHATRLPRKILLDICGKTALERVVDRCRQVASADEVLVACPMRDETEIYKATGIAPFPGYEHDLVSRLLAASKVCNEGKGVNKIVRITADCPLIDPAVIQRTINHACVVKRPVTMNWAKRWYPNGQDVDVWDVAWLEKWASQELTVTDREWFPLKILKDEPDSIHSVMAPYDASHFRMTLDYEKDLIAIREIQKAMGADMWGWEKICDWLRSNPRVISLTAKYRDETGEKIS